MIMDAFLVYDNFLGHFWSIFGPGPGGPNRPYTI